MTKEKVKEVSASSALTPMRSVEKRVTSDGKRVYHVIQKYHAPSKKHDGAVGIRLEARGDGVVATVKGIKVLVTPLDGKCALSDPRKVKDGFKDATDFRFSVSLSASSFREVKSFLESKYCFSQRDFTAIYALALEGKPLLTKRERKELELELEL